MTDSTPFTPFSRIIGQDKAIKFLKGVMARGKIPHAYLFTGISGVGKTTTAVALTQALNCHEPVKGEGCGRCLPCRTVINGNFPDLEFIEPDGRNIKIEQIRDLNRKFGFKPLSGRFRVSIVRHAETMTTEAANSFLKTLEEPPRDTVLILTVTEPRDLLPTIVSRCQKILFRPIPIIPISKWLVDKKNLDEEKALVLAKISEGSLGRAIQMSDVDFFEKRQEALFRLIRLSDLSTEQALEMALEYSGKEKKRHAGTSKKSDVGLFDLLSVWKTWYRDLLFVKVKCPAELLINFDFTHKLKNNSENFIIDNLIDSLMVINEAQRDLLRSRNLDLMMENTLLTLRRLAVRKERQKRPYE